MINIRNVLPSKTSSNDYYMRDCDTDGLLDNSYPRYCLCRFGYG